MHPLNSTFRLPHRDVQTRGGVPADAAPVAGRHTTPRHHRFVLPRIERPLNHVYA